MLVEQDHVVAVSLFELGLVESDAVRQRIVDLFSQIGFQLATRVAAGLGAVPPASDVGAKPPHLAPEVSVELSANQSTILSRMAALLCDDGVDDDGVAGCEARFQAAEGAIVEIAACRAGSITGARGAHLRVAKSLPSASPCICDAAVVAAERAVSTA